MAHLLVPLPSTKAEDISSVRHAVHIRRQVAQQARSVPGPDRPHVDYEASLPRFGTTNTSITMSSAGHRKKDAAR
jgi:hypothetical protein